jgi:hypothetical protein
MLFTRLNSMIEMQNTTSEEQQRADDGDECGADAL